MYQDDPLQQYLWMNDCVDISSFYISTWGDQVVTNGTDSYIMHT